MEKTTLYLPPDVQRDLREAAKRAGRPQAELVREAINQYLAKQPRPLPSSLGIAADGSLDATDVDAWLEKEWDRDNAGHLGDVRAPRPKRTKPRGGKGRAAR